MNIVVLGISTGGPNTLRSMFRGLERLDAAMVLVQHMPKFVNAPLSRSLDELTDMDVVVAQHDQTLQHGWVYVAPSESHTRLRDNRTMQLWHGPKVNFVQPSADVTMQSLQASAIDRLVAVVMTGMGADGAIGPRQGPRRDYLRPGRTQQRDLRHARRSRPHRLRRFHHVPGRDRPEAIGPVRRDALHPGGRTGLERNRPMVDDHPHKTKVLVVDDEPVARELLAGTLEDFGYEVVAAHNGQQALDLLRTQEISLVVSDWLMPVMDGLGLCQEIRALPEGRYVYVILLTAKGGPSHAVEGLAAGADDFISKPFHPDELAMRLSTGERILANEALDLTIFAMAKLAESRDPDTGAHLERVQRYCHVLATDMADNEYTDRINADFVRLLYQTCPLHDIGKVAIPDSVLLKPGRLNDREFEIMKTHAAHGAMTLDRALAKYPNASFLRIARDVAGHHHERWDGSGYPDGLAREEIPLAARVFALADVYDALVSRRVYKEEFSHDVARSLILEGEGTQFDPVVVGAFRRCETTFASIVRTFVDPAEPVACN